MHALYIGWRVYRTDFEKNHPTLQQQNRGRFSKFRGGTAVRMGEPAACDNLPETASQPITPGF